jgi:hypothetical protein
MGGERGERVRRRWWVGEEVVVVWERVEWERRGG